MSDSDEDIMGETVHSLRHNSVNSKATNMNRTNITSIRYRHNSMTKLNNYRQINGWQSSNQEHNMYYRRETSPMSFKSLCYSRPQSFRNYPDGTRSQMSAYNDRGGSPTSMISVGTNVTVSAVDFIQGLKNNLYNKRDLKLIKEALNQFEKKQTRKRIEKRWNLKFKSHRRKPGISGKSPESSLNHDDDSGEQGIDSSMSSDDCKSTRTFPNSKRSAPRTDLTHFRSSIRDCDMYRDCTDTLKQTRLQNILSLYNTNVTHEKHDAIIHQNQKCTSIAQKNSQKNVFNTRLKDCFPNGTYYSSSLRDRFNKSDVNSNNTTTSRNKNVYIQNGDKNNKINQQNIDADDSKEEIFSEAAISENTQHSQQKRFLEDSEAEYSDKKRYKVTSPIKQNNVPNITQDSFHFKKPQRPAGKYTRNKRGPVPEMIIAKSKPLPDSLHLDLPNKSSDNLEQTHNKIPVNSTEIDETSNQTKISQNTTDVSMKSTFIKRKLFTQKLDVAENKNLSSGNVGTNSPQTKLCSGVREKNKVRKLVTSQSCLSQDVLGNDNMLDLIHKIVPPSQINMTTVLNKREINKTNENVKWNVTSFTSTCNTSAGSNTFTDDETGDASSNLYERPKTVQQAVENFKDSVDLSKNNKPKIVSPCKVTGPKLPIAKSKENQRGIEANKPNCPNKISVSKCIKSFWDSDFESEVEETNEKSKKCEVGKEIEKSTLCNNTVMNVDNKKNNTRGTILTIRSLQNKIINSSIRSSMRQVSKISKNTIIQENKDVMPEKSQTNNNLNRNTKSKKSKPTKKDSENELENIKPKSVQTKSKATTKENACNISRQSLRLKEKKEKKRPGKVYPQESSNNTRDNEDPIILSQPTKKPQNNKTNTKNNKNINKNYSNNETVTGSVKKNNTIKQTPKKKQQTRNLFATPVSDSSFNISLSSLRVRHIKV